MMKCFKVPYSQHKRRLTVDELIKGFQKEMNDCFPSLRRSLMNAEEKRQKRLADERGKEVLLLEPMSFCVREVGFYNKVISLSCLQLRMILYERFVFI